LKREFIPGWIAMALLAWLSSLASGLVGRPLMSAWNISANPVEAAVVAIVLGVLLRNVGLLPKFLDPGIRAYEKPLIWGIILYGASLNFAKLAGEAPRIFVIVIATMLIGYGAIYFVGRAFRLPRKLSILLSVGTTICGGSAIAITSPLIEAEEQETSYAVTTIALWGLMAIIVYPLVARAMHVSDPAFGVFAGTAIHSTPQVVGAGFIYSETAGNMATAVKLVRNCFMVPLAMLVAIWYTSARASSSRREGKHINWVKAFPWFLFGFFVMAALGTAGFFTPEGLAHFKKWARFLILMGMAGIGMSTRFASFRGIGIKPFIVGLIGSIIVAVVSIGFIIGLGLNHGPGRTTPPAPREEAACRSTFHTAMTWSGSTSPMRSSRGSISRASARGLPTYGMK